MEEPEIVPNMDGSENNVGDLTLAFAAVVYAQTIEEPRSLSEALNLPQANNWKNRIGDEIRSLLQTSTFEFISSLPPSRKAISSKLVF